MDQLKEAWDRAFSIESMPEERIAEKLGRIQSGKRIYEFYQDNEGDYWFKNFFETEEGVISEHEYIFGKKHRRRRA